MTGPRERRDRSRRRLATGFRAPGTCSCSRSASNPRPGGLPSQHFAASARSRRPCRGRRTSPASRRKAGASSGAMDLVGRAPGAGRWSRRCRASTRLPRRPRDTWRSARPFRSPAVEAGDVEDMGRRPAVSPIADVGARALLPIRLDRRRDQALPGGVVDLRGAAPPRRRRPARRQRPPPPRTRPRGITSEPRVGLSSLAGWPGMVLAMPVPEVTTNGRPEPASAAPRAAITRRSSSQLAANREKSWLKARWMTPVGPRGAGLEAVRVLQRSPMDLGAGGGQGRSLVLRAAEPDHLMARPDQFLDDGRADEPGGAVTNTRMSKLSSYLWRQVSAYSLFC